MNVAGLETVVAAEAPLDPSVTELGFQLEPAEGGGLELQLLIDGEGVGRATVERPMPVGMLQVGGTGLCIGYDQGFPVTDSYRPPFRFTGRIHHLTIQVPDGPDDPRSRMAQALHED